MLNNITYGKYVYKNSKAYLLNPMFKIISFILMIFVCFFINSYIDVIMLFSYLLLGVIYSDVNIKVYLKELGLIKWFLLFILIIDIISLTKIVIILSDLFRVIFIFLYFSLLMKCTRFNEIITGWGGILKPFNRLNKENIILDISLVFKFPYIYLNERKKCKSILAVKKAKERDNCKKEIIKYKDNVIHIFNLSIDRLNNMKLELKRRLFGYGKSRTNYKESNFDIKEIIFMSLNMIILIIVIFYK